MMGRRTTGRGTTPGLAWAWAGLLAVAACLSGCASNPGEGYALMGTYPDGIRTIAVPIVTNDTFTRDIEFQLTDALVKTIESRTPYKVVPSNRADSILLGRIRRVELDRVSKSRQTGLGGEVVVSMTIDFEWRDTRTGEELVIREDYSGHGLFMASDPVGDSIEIGQFTAVQQLAGDIVDEMRSTW